MKKFIADNLTSLLSVLSSFRDSLHSSKEVVYFDKNSDVLTQESKKIIYEFVAVTPKDIVLQVATQFDSEESISVAQARGLAVVRYIQQIGGNVHVGCTMSRGERKATIFYW